MDATTAIHPAPAPVMGVPKAKPARQGLPWTPDETARAIRMRRDGVSPADIADALGRSRATVYTHLRKNDCVLANHQAWDDADLARLRALLDAGATDAKAADALGRKVGSIRWGRQRIGAVVPWAARPKKPVLPLWMRRKIVFGPPLPKKPRKLGPKWTAADTDALHDAVTAPDPREAVETLRTRMGISKWVLARRAEENGVILPTPPTQQVEVPDAVVRAAWNAHGTVKGVAVATGLGRYATSERLQELGIRTKRARRPVTPDTVVEIRRLAPTTHLSEIARILGIERGTVRSVTDREGIEVATAPPRTVRTKPVRTRPKAVKVAQARPAPTPKPRPSKVEKPVAEKPKAVKPAKTAEVAAAQRRERIVRTPHKRPSAPVVAKAPVVPKPVPRKLSPAEVLAGLRARRATAKAE